tara:strand:- start:724 stop:1137 length:414 start_codon:yes stop_codon:yes gene_type:complete
MITFSTSVRVRYGETDQMGFCYYGNYAQFLEVARVEALRTCGFSYKELEDQGVLLPVRSYSIKYISPAKYDDILKIQTTITKLEGARIEFSYVIHTSEDVLIAKAETDLVFVSADSLRPIPMPKKFKELVLKLESEQ